MQKIQETPQTKNQDKEQVQNCAKRKVNTKKKKSITVLHTNHN